MKKRFLLVPLGIVTLWLYGCAQQELPSATSTPSQPMGEVQLENREGWQSEWQGFVKAAKREGRVVVYGGTTTRGLKDASPLLREKFGIELDMTIGQGAQLSRKFLQEKAAGVNVADILMLGPNSMIGSVKPAGVTVPMEPVLLLPEVRDPKAWFGGKLPWVDKDRHIISFFAYPSAKIAVNTELVRPGDVKSYFDILDPRWKGKIAMLDPTVSGPGFSFFCNLILNKLVSVDYFKQLVSISPILSRDDRFLGEGLARGKFAVVAAYRTGSVEDYRNAGAPIGEIEVKEGHFLSQGGSPTVLIDRAPHPNAARVVINWLLSREGQTTLQNAVGLQSTREDISISGVPNVRTKGQAYFPDANAQEEWILHEQDVYEKMAKDIFAPLLK